ncbi:MAG: 2-amino-4-hydroxy-6-hydroxymethyldihydropteridine diphosphokinase [Rhizomicrobium sp.]
MILIALGGNLDSPAGPPALTLRAALAALEKNGANIVAVSAYYVTPAWPDPSDPPFVNAVARLRTALAPADLLDLLHQIETAFGRRRSARNAPRTLDLDILDYDGLVQSGPPELPHPRLAERAFVLVPLAELAPDWIHPVTRQTVGGLVAGLSAAEREAVRPLSST